MGQNPWISYSHSSPILGSAVSVAELLAQSLRVMQYRTAVPKWVPPEDRQKVVKSKRGWEKASAHGVNAPARQGGWITRTLLFPPPNSSLDVILQATYVIANLANGSSAQRALILHHPPLLRVIGTVIADFPRGFEGGDARKPAIGTILTLAKGCATVISSPIDTGATTITIPQCRQIMIDAGVVGTLRRICESQGGIVGVGIGHHHHHHLPGAGVARGSLVHSHSYP